MLIPKNKKTEIITNHFRPKVGLPAPHSICKLDWKEYHIEPDESVVRIRVDAEHNDEFIAVLEATIPKKDRYRCTDHEVYLIDKEWKDFLLEQTAIYFDETIKELRTWS